MTKTNTPFTQDWVKGLRLMDILTKVSKFKDLELILTIEPSPLINWAYERFKPLIKDSVIVHYLLYQIDNVL